MIETSKQNEDNKIAPHGVTVKRQIMWWFINPAMLTVLYFALLQNVEWCQNLIKFCVWVNFILWLLILLSGEKGQKPLKDRGLPVSATTNGIYGIMFAGALACFGWFGYAGMEITTLISQQITYFREDTYRPEHKPPEPENK